MGAFLIRVLVVDDHKPWRRFCSSALQEQPEFQVISDACDGLEAVQKAHELQPDLLYRHFGRQDNL